jgi:hypothetical protein
MSEYISKDDAKVLIDMLDSKQYSLKDAKDMLSIKERLQKYIDNPKSTQLEVKE